MIRPFYLLVLGLLGACTSSIVTLPPQETATQQLIMSSAAQKAIASLALFAASSAYPKLALDRRAQ
jgi:hypothetical protein